MEDNKEKKESSNSDYTWLAIGMLFVICMSMALDNIAIGICFGLTIGLCFKNLNK